MHMDFAGVRLSDFLNIKTVNTSILPSRENYSINIPSRVGEIYNGFKYGTREIEIDFIVRPEDPFEYPQYVADIADVLDVIAPSPLYLGDESKYYYAVPDGEVEINEIGPGIGEGHITFICYDPIYYCDEEIIFEGENRVDVENNGNTITYPQVDVNFSKESSFAQITNTETGEAVLVGQMGGVDNSTISKAGTVINDKCETLTDWVSIGNVLDSGRTVSGNFTINTNGYAITPSDFGEGSNESIRWHGPARRRNLGRNVKDFEVIAHFEFDSKGTNKSSSSNTPSNSKYKTTANLNLRSGRGTSYKILTTLPKNKEITVSEISKGWGKVTYNSKIGYCSMQYLKLVSSSSSSNTHKVSTGGANLNLRSSRSTSSKILLSIPNGTQLKVADIKNGWGKTTYKNKAGYVYTKYLTALKSITKTSDNNKITDTADDKLGLIELYGFDSNNNKLFKMTLTDPKAYFEYTYPKVEIGNTEVLRDNAKVPNPKKKTIKDDKGKTTTVNDLSGKFGKWNEFYGTIKIKRKTVGKNQQWYCEINKLKNGKVTASMKTTTLVNSKYPTGELNHLVLFIGGYKERKTSSMTLTNLRVNQLNTVGATVIPKIFEQGDKLTVDCEQNMVFINDVPAMSEVDIGSNFFGLDPGDTQIKITSDDDGIFTSVNFNERWL